MAVICELKFLERLCFDQCFFGRQIPTPVPGPGVRLQTLIIYSIEVSNANIGIVLRMVAAYVKNLTVAIKRVVPSRPTLMELIAEHVPNVEPLTVDYAHKADTANYAVVIKSLFGHLPRLVVNGWMGMSCLGRYSGLAVHLDISN